MLQYDGSGGLSVEGYRHDFNDIIEVVNESVLYAGYVDFSTFHDGGSASPRHRLRAALKVVVHETRNDGIVNNGVPDSPVPIGDFNSRSK